MFDHFFPSSDWWAIKLSTHPYGATTKVSQGILPQAVDDTIYGHFISLKVGEDRLWSFKEKSGRDKFCNDYKGVPT